LFIEDDTQVILNKVHISYKHCGLLH